eukprot:2091017-Alexandrium_andersonii.AAC.1
MGSREPGELSMRTKSLAIHSTPHQLAPRTNASGGQAVWKALWRAPARFEGAAAGAVVGT